MSKIDDKDKSLTRTKKTATSLLELLGPEAISSLIPGGTLAYGFAKTLVNHAIQFHEDRKQSRINDFHKMLLEGTSKEDYEIFFKQEFSSEDYYSLLSSTIRDDEDAKTIFYSKIFKALIIQKIPEKYKRHFIKSIRELSYSDIEILRGMYISSKHEIKCDTNTFTLQDSFPPKPEKIDPIRNISIQALERLGFVDVHNNTIGENPTENISHPTELVKPFVEALYGSEDLTPKSIGKESWKGMSAIPILVNDLEKHKDVMNALEESLRELNIKYIHLVPNMSVKPDLSPIHKSDYLILCLDYSTYNLHVETFVTQPQIKDKKFIKILVSAESDNKPHDPIPGVKALSTFKFMTDDSFEVDKFKDFMRIKTDIFE